jgi:hypothetical protein
MISTGKWRTSGNPLLYGACQRFPMFTDLYPPIPEGVPEYCLLAVLARLPTSDLSLSRQMEFNADDAAVSAAGSYAIVGMLCRVEFADQCQSLIATNCRMAAEHGLYSRKNGSLRTSWRRKRFMPTRMSGPTGASCRQGGPKDGMALCLTLPRDRCPPRDSGYRLRGS